MVKSKCMVLHEDGQPKPTGGRKPLNPASRSNKGFVGMSFSVAR